MRLKGVIRGSTEEVFDELRERAVRLYRKSDPKPVSRQLASLGVHHEALRNWIREDEADRGQRDDRQAPPPYCRVSPRGVVS
ncbi:transposase [Micromonospora sp. NPDC048898]|uniref:transposase n=1 Tax=Micromonospora sp. NPDC048898 TaxID=3364260 RepID=UPI0037176185